MARSVDHLQERTITLPDDDVLTPHRLRTVGSVFGMSYGVETVHWLLDDAWADDELHPEFLYQVELSTGFVDNVLYPCRSTATARGRPRPGGRPGASTSGVPSSTPTPGRSCSPPR